jgi:uncharacterized membrane protein YccC
MSRQEAFDALLDRLNTDLSLSADQTARVRGLLEAHMEQRRAIRRQHEDKAARREAIKPLNQQLRRDIGGMLDAGQKATFQANKAAYKDMLKG